MTKLQLQAIKTLADRNLHVEARIKIAKILNCKKQRKILNNISDIQQLEGYAPDSILTYRAEITTELLKIARKQLNTSEYLSLCRSL